MNIHCIECGVKLGFNNIGLARDINDKPIRCCRDCADIVLHKLKESMFVEKYNGNDIYSFQGRYYSYWGCTYSYDTIEGVKSRIDNKGISIVPGVLLSKIMRGRNLNVT